jgi:hypothetical protein
VARDINMRHLSESVNSGVRSSSSVQFHCGRRHQGESALEMILNPVPVWLTLPPAERSPVICDGELQAFERRAHSKESR